MFTMKRLILSAALALVILPVAASAIVEEKTKVEYPDQVTVKTMEGEAELHVTGVGLREKTFMKVDVYTIVSYVMDPAAVQGEDAGVALCSLQAPKRLQMDLRRGFSREKLINAFVEVIEKNYEDTSGFDADMETFKAYFTRDAQDGDMIVFDFCPQAGLTTTLNGEVKGTIANKAFAEALWSVWFGAKPANGGLKKDLLSALGA